MATITKYHEAASERKRGLQSSYVFFQSSKHIWYFPQLIEDYLFKGAGSFHIHRKTMKELGALAVLGVREQPNLAQNLVTHRHW